MNAKRMLNRLKGSRQKLLIITNMKKYEKAKMIAKNLPTGSYAAGCPTNTMGTNWSCKQCERTM